MIYNCTKCFNYLQFILFLFYRKTEAKSTGPEVSNSQTHKLKTHQIQYLLPFYLKLIIYSFFIVSGNPPCLFEHYAQWTAIHRQSPNGCSAKRAQFLRAWCGGYLLFGTWLTLSVMNIYYYSVLLEYSIFHIYSGSWLFNLNIFSPSG